MLLLCGHVVQHLKYFTWNFSKLNYFHSGRNISMKYYKYILYLNVSIYDDNDILSYVE